jgi:hypothetical protein
LRKKKKKKKSKNAFSDRLLVREIILSKKIYKIVKARHGTVTVEWICGYNNDPKNVFADITAKETVHGGTVSWMVDLTKQEVTRAFVFYHGSLMEIDLRQLLKQQRTIRHHQQWTSQRQKSDASFG